MASLFQIDQLPKTSQDACREFDERYLAGVSGTPPKTWSRDLGDVVDVGSPMTTFPISLMTAKYQETNGESRAKTMGERSFDLKTVEYDDGYEASLLGVNGLTVNAFAYRKWQEAPQRFILAEGKFVNRKLAALLEANPVSGYDKVAFFHASAHLANPADPDVGTWGNLQSVAKSCTAIADILGEMAAMRGVLDENGDKLDVNPDTIVVPSQKYDACNAEISKQYLSGGESNALAGKLNVVICPELTDVNDWYLLDSQLIRAQGISPWVAARHVVPESLGLRHFDESSDFFKNTGKIKVTSHIWYGFALAFPHAIRKVVGS